MGGKMQNIIPEKYKAFTVLVKDSFTSYGSSPLLRD